MQMKVAFMLCLPVASFAQSVRTTVLAPANATLSEELSDVSSVRELRDGRVLVTDRREGRLIVADFRLNRSETIGQKGQGPNEYPEVTSLLSTGGDSTIMIIPGRRWLLLHGSSIIGTLPPDAPAVLAARMRIRGASATGSVFAAADIANATNRMGDSTPLLRIDRATGKTDTVARLKATVARQTSARDKNGYFQFTVPVLRTSEEVIPFADGTVAIVRVDPYRVDWFATNGSVTHGAPLPFPAVRMTDGEKRAYVNRVARRSGNKPVPIEAITEWPDVVPPFLSPASVFSSPDKHAVIGRLASDGHPEVRYDIVNRSGGIDSQLLLQPNEDIVGFGARCVYIVETNDDGIQHLRRHPWPALKRK